MRALTVLMLVAIGACHATPDDEGGQPAVNQQLGTPAIAAAPSRPPDAKSQSRFTALDPNACKLIEQSEEGPYWRRRCEGVAGYSAEWTESDLRQGLVVIRPDGRRDELPISAVVANGAFNHLGPRIEWRDVDPAKPATITVRVFVANADPAKPDRSLLAVARLRPKTCLVAVVEPGPNQSEQARRIADGAPPCLEI